MCKRNDLLVVGEDVAWKLEDIFVSEDISEISQNIKEQVVDKIKNLLRFPYSWTNQMMSHKIFSYCCFCNMCMRKILRISIL